MEKEKTADKSVDYFQIMRDFDKTQGKAPDDFDIPLRSSSKLDGGVDYLSVSRKWKEYLDSSCSPWHLEQLHESRQVIYIQGRKVGADDP